MHKLACILTLIFVQLVLAAPCFGNASSGNTEFGFTYDSNFSGNVRPGYGSTFATSFQCPNNLIIPATALITNLEFKFEISALDHQCLVAKLLIMPVNETNYLPALTLSNRMPGAASGLQTYEGSTSQFDGALAKGLYAIEISNYCAQTVTLNSSYYKVYWADNGVTGTSDILPSASEVKLFPNPSSDVVRLSLPKNLNIEKLQIKLYNFAGQEVMNRSNESFSTELAFDIGFLDRGQYLLQVESESSGNISKFVKSFFKN